MPAPSIVGTPLVTTIATSSGTPSWDATQSRAAGHLLFFTIAMNRGSTLPTLNSVTSGWTAVGGGLASGVDSGGVWIVYKNLAAAGSDAAPTLTFSTACTWRATSYEYDPTNLDLTAGIPEFTYTVVNDTTSGSHTTSLASHTNSNSYAEWVFLFAGGRGNPGTLSWTGGSAASVTGIGNASSSWGGSASDTIGPSSSATYGASVGSNGTAGPTTGIIGVAFKIAPTATTKNLSATLTFTSSQTRATTHGLTGVLSFAGSLPRAVSRVLAAVLSFAGSMPRAVVSNQRAALTFTSTQRRNTIHGMTAGLTPAGSLNRVLTRTIGAALSFAGSLTTSRFKQLVLNAALGFTSAMGRNVTSNQRANLTPSGSLTRSIVKHLAGAASFTGALTSVKQRILNLTASLGFTGTLNRSTTSNKAGAVSFAGSLSKNSAKHLTGVLGFTGALTTARQRIVNLAASLGFTGTLSKRTGKNLPASLTPTGTLTRRTTKTLTAAVSFAGSLTKAIRKNLISTLRFAGALAARFLGPPRDVTLTVAMDSDRWATTLELDRYTTVLEPDRYLITMEDDVPRTIRASLGDQSYVSLLVTEAHGDDITGDTFQISLGTYTTPGTWHTPDVSESVSAGVQRVKLLVGAAGTINPAVGAYYPWVRIADNPETESLFPFDKVTIT